MDLLVGIVNLVVLLFIIEGWVTGRIPGALARATADRVDARLNDPATPANARLERLVRRTDEIGIRLDGLDRRMDELGARLDGLDRRLSELDTRVGQFDTRLDRVDAQVAVLNAQTSQQIADLDRRVRERLRGLDRRESTPEAETSGGAAGAS